MSATSSTDKLAWYKHKWLWFLLSGPIIVVVASVFTIYKAVTVKDSLIVDDYYAEGTTINKVIVKDQNAAKLGLSAQVVMGDDKRIRVFVKQKEGSANFPALSLFLQHASDEKMDKKVTLTPDGAPGSYVSAEVAIPVGKWYLDLSDTKGTWKLSGQIKTNKDFQVSLKAA